MRIVHVITTISRGGAENQLLLLTAEQVRQGFEVEVIPLKDNLELHDEFLQRGVKIRLDAWGKSILGQIFAIRRLCLQPDLIVHVHLPQAELICSIAGIRKVICSRHYGSQFFPNKNARFSRILSRFATRHTALVISISKFVEEFLRSNNEVDIRLPIKTIYYGINLEETSKFVHQRELSPLKTPIIIGTLARLSPEKDLLTLIKGIQLLTKQYPQQVIELHIYGEGPLRIAIEKDISARNLNNCVFLKGKTQQPLKSISSFDIFVLSSKYEGFGLVLLEALALEIPIVCSDIPTAKEVLGNTGVYFHVGDPSNLALKTSRVLFGKGVEQVRQRERAKEFDIKKKTQEHLRVYSELAISEKTKSP